MKDQNRKRDWEIIEEEWPDFKGRIFRNRPRNLVELLENTVNRYPQKEGFICDSQRLTFGEFGLTVDRIAAGLKSYGVKKGDRVSLLLGIGPDFPLTFFALMKLQAIAVPLNTRFMGEELAFEINDSESSVLIVDEDYWPQIASVRNELQHVQTIFFNGPGAPDGVRSLDELRGFQSGRIGKMEIAETDDALILYTSGTTGRP